jgi:hypothetical protein
LIKIKVKSYMLPVEKNPCYGSPHNLLIGKEVAFAFAFALAL